MFRYNLKPVWEALKEPLRLAIFAGVSVLITQLLKVVIALPETETTVILTFILRFIDKAIHEFGKLEDNKTLTLGLVRF